MSSMGNPTPSSTLVHKLRLMADAGGMLTRDRIRVLMESADRIEDLDERIAIMAEEGNADFPYGQNIGGEEQNEKH